MFLVWLFSIWILCFFLMVSDVSGLGHFIICPRCWHIIYFLCGLSSSILLLTRFLTEQNEKKLHTHKTSLHLIFKFTQRLFWFFHQPVIKFSWKRKECQENENEIANLCKYPYQIICNGVFVSMCTVHCATCIELRVFPYSVRLSLYRLPVFTSSELLLLQSLCPYNASPLYESG